MEISSKEFFELINSPCSTSLSDNVWIVIKDGQIIIVEDTPDGYYKYQVSDLTELIDLLSEFL